jgi:hypothetical protein
MPQTARPRSDVSDTGWTPQPVAPQLNEVVPNDASLVTSSANPQGDTFEVKLDALAWPDNGPQTLTVRLQATGSTPFPNVIVLLLQGTAIIAYRTVQPTATFTNYDFALTQAEIDLITDYTNLHLRVTAGLALTTGCSQLPNGAAQHFIFTPAGITPNRCAYCEELNQPTEISYVSGCVWQQPPAEAVCGSLFWQFQGMGNGVWQLTAPSWDGQSPLTLPLTVGTDGSNSCLNFPSSLTLTPI